MAQSIVARVARVAIEVQKVQKALQEKLFLEYMRILIIYYLLVVLLLLLPLTNQ